MLGRRALRRAARRGQAGPPRHRRDDGRRRPTRPAGTAAAVPGPAIKVALLGDSSAAGYGVERVAETTGACWPAGSRSSADRRVHLRVVRRGRARAPPTWSARSTAPCRPSPHVAVILIGANDVTHSVLPSAVGAPPLRGGPPAARRRRRGRRRAPVPTSARSSRSRRRSSRSAAPGRTASPPRRRSRSSRRAVGPSRSASILGPEFEAAPALLFGPGPVPPVGRRLPPAGRRAAAVDARRARPRPRGRGRARGLPRRGRAARHDGGRPRPSKTPGTEVDGTEVGGSRRGMRGLWVEMRHRRRRRPPPPRSRRGTRTQPRPRARPRARSRPTSPSVRVATQTREDMPTGRGHRDPGPQAVSAVRQSELKNARMRSRLV